LGEVVVDDELGHVPARDSLLEAGELRPRTGVDDEQRVEAVEGEVRRPTVLDVVEYDVVLAEDERVLPREVAEQQDLRFDAPLTHREDHRGGGAEGVAVGSDVGRHEHALAARQRVDDRSVRVGGRDVGHGERSYAPPRWGHAGRGLCLAAWLRGAGSPERAPATRGRLN
jgi:hypothetical protein